MMKMMKQLWNDESGQGLPEYALLVAAVVVMVVVATALFSDTVQELFNGIDEYIENHSQV